MVQRLKSLTVAMETSRCDNDDGINLPDIKLPSLGVRTVSGVDVYTKTPISGSDGSMYGFHAVHL